MNKKIFISYSWTTPEHEKWVVNLAERLMSDGINVILDKWDLKEGHDIYDFMESMVKSEEINKVLMVLDKKYSEKADSRTGGVGTETQIISPKIYKNIQQDKFIPLVKERDENGNALIPTYLEGRVYIDFSSEARFEENYEQLLRNIYERPNYSKPKLGKAPSYIFEDSLKGFKTTQLLRRFDHHIEKYPNRIDSFVRNFLDTYFENLREFSIEFTSRDHSGIGKLICENHQKYVPLRNDFIFFIDKLTKIEIDFDFDTIINFLEKLPLLEDPAEGRSSWSPYEFDNFRIFIYETFLYLIAIGLKNKNYKFVENVLYSTYFLEGRNNYNNEPSNYEEFYRNVATIDKYYKETYSRNFLNPMADLVIKSIPESFDISHLVQADLLCYYIANLNNRRWFPQTYIYDKSRNKEIYYKMVSLKHFEKVKILFDVNSVEEFKEKLVKLKERDLKNSNNLYGYSRSFDRVTPIYEIIEVDKIGTKR